MSQAAGKDGLDALAARIEELARAPVLLVASDFDGTLAPIVARPEAAAGEPRALAALAALGAEAQTHAAVISGRALDDLRARLPAASIALVGSHGAERDGPPALLPARAVALARARQAAESLAARVAGAQVERKPAGVAFHVRNAEAGAAAAALAELRATFAAAEGGRVIAGKQVLELTFADGDKGSALARLRREVGATAVLFLGDDVTDDDAFLQLGATDVGVAVGEGERPAPHAVADPAAVAVLLETLLERRRAWLAQLAEQAVPIERHALLSDQRAFALVTPHGRIVWACLPRLDSSALFAELLGGPEHGYFEVGAADGSAPLSQGYLEGTLLLETRWPGFRVVDYLDAGGGRAFQRAGRSDLIRVVEGRGRVRIAFAPRAGFGRAVTRLVAVDGGLVVEGVREACALRAPGVAFTLASDPGPVLATAEVELGAEPLLLELRYGTHSVAAASEPEARRRERTGAHWSAWAKTLELPERARDRVLRSALTLRALTYGPTGAIAAAATTSLPEQMGGMRNWDYRLCWPRDAAISAAALVRLGATGPALKLLDWMLGIFDTVSPGTVLAPVYTVAGGNVAPEAEIPDLPGYRASRPVRVGNLASEQVQLDLYGPIVELLALLAERGAPLSFDHWRMVEAIAATVSQHWRDPDHGIWEIRGALQHHLHTKVMCWLAADRACRVSRYLGRECGEWVRLRSEIEAEILERGPRPGDGSFGAAYGGEHADAAALWVGLSGLLRPDDPRFLATVRRVEEELFDGTTVRRYRYADGLPGIEGGFNFCTTWLIRAWLLTGRNAEAEQLFDRYCSLAGPLGLLAEEFDPQRSEALGNYPQAYSHAGLIEAALDLDALRADAQEPRRGV